MSHYTFDVCWFWKEMSYISMWDWICSHRCVDRHRWHPCRCHEACRAGCEGLRPQQQLHAGSDCSHRSGNMGSNTQQGGSGEYRGEAIIFTHVVCGNSHHLDSGESNYDFFLLPFHCLPLRRVVSQLITQWTWRAKAGCPASITTTPTSCWWMTAPTDNTARRLNFVAAWRNASPESFLETKVKNSCKWYHLISVSIYLLCFDYWFFFFLLRSREQRDHPRGVCGSGRRSWHSECESSVFISVLCLCLSCLTLVCLSLRLYTTPCWMGHHVWSWRALGELQMWSPRSQDCQWPGSLSPWSTCSWRSSLALNMTPFLTSKS